MATELSLKIPWGNLEVEEFGAAEELLSEVSLDQAQHGRILYLADVEPLFLVTPTPTPTPTPIAMKRNAIKPIKIHNILRRRRGRPFSPCDAAAGVIDF